METQVTVIYAEFEALNSPELYSVKICFAKEKKLNLSQLHNLGRTFCWMSYSFNLNVDNFCLFPGATGAVRRTVLPLAAGMGA